MRFFPAFTLFLALAAMSAAAAPARPANDGSVLFYAGFEGTADAASAGDGKGTARAGSPRFAAGQRGQALLTGEAGGQVTYAVPGNLLPDRGSVEFWFNMQGWEASDPKHHALIEATGPGWLLFYKYYEGTNAFLLTSRRQENWTVTATDIRALKPGEWHHAVVTWERAEACVYLDGKQTACQAKPQVPDGLSGRFIVGDHDFAAVGTPRPPSSAGTLMDELYIYGRALSPPEVAWAYGHAAERVSGQDVPETLTPPVRLSVRPFPLKGQIQVEADINPRFAGRGFQGTAKLEPAAGTRPERLRFDEPRQGVAAIRFQALPGGDYQVRLALHDEQGREQTLSSGKITSPGPPVWRGNRIGISSTPPPPWTPLVLRGKGFRALSCWGREYRFGDLGMPKQIISAGAKLLAAPIAFHVDAGGRPVTWTPGPTAVVSRTGAVVTAKGWASSIVGALEWTAAAEFDGMIRYDLVLRPAEGAVVDGMELRAALNPAHATLYHLARAVTDNLGGAAPASFQANWASYWWLGDEERGLAGFCESDEAWDRVDRKDGFRIERTGASVDAVWSFAASPRKLQKPWRFTFGIQATPVKDTTGFRKLRFEPGLHFNATVPWPTPKTVRHYGYPEAVDAVAYRAMVKGLHAKGPKALPYSLLNYLSAGAPEAFYAEEWASGETWPAIGDVGEFGHPMIGCLPTRDWVDFVLWKNERFVREMDLDGLYHDFTWPSTCTRPDEGYGYLRDGVIRPKVSIFGVREMYKRIYTMLKEHGRRRGKEMLMIGHTSSPAFIPLMSLCDACLAGEQFIPTIKDNYLDVISLAQLRAEFSGGNLGVAPVFLPELKPEFQKTPAATENVVGLALLHDFLLWPIYINPAAADRTYAVLDDFGLADAQRLPYWSNADVIAGQTETVKCTAYRKPRGGALVCIFNTERSPQTALLTIEWERLKSPGTLQVTDAFTQAPMQVDGKSVAVEVPPINFRLLRVR